VSTITAFDFERLSRATEERAAPRSCRRPSNHHDRRRPLAAGGAAPAARAAGHPRSLDDMCAREMSPRVQHTVKDAPGPAYTKACRYPEGTDVLGASDRARPGGRSRPDRRPPLRREGVTRWEPR
jgi:hypothetical protein